MIHQSVLCFTVSGVYWKEMNTVVKMMNFLRASLFSIAYSGSSSEKLMQMHSVAQQCKIAR